MEHSATISVSCSPAGRPGASTSSSSTSSGLGAPQLTATARGNRTVCIRERLDTWGIPYGSDVHDVLTLIVAELSANAVRHGRVPGRDFRLRLSAEGATLRVEVTDSRGESIPALTEPSDDLDAGRGLLLVAALTDRWGWYPCVDGPGKTVWAVLDVGLA
ncbi:ATP-binding protein [Streptomyces sp. NPDC005151]